MAPDWDGEKKFEVVDHTADWGLCVYGRDLADLLANAALGMTFLMVGDLDRIPLDEARTLELEAFDAETLLVDWLNELAYWAEDELLVFPEFALSQVTEQHLSAVVRGGKAAELQKHIKAVTYHNLEIVKHDGGFMTTIIFDV
ncbi:MAG: archease [Candidatus Promineifilaceae bacterium]